MGGEISQESLAQLSPLVARLLGLHFPRDRWPELQRGIVAAARELGFEGEAGRCARWLAERSSFTRQQLESLATHLTVGETYFFRERRHFDFLAERIVPDLISRGERRVRIWSAGCCTGEEAYSIAIVLRRLIPDLENWQVMVLGTDINPHSLHKARAGIFGSWSFRDAPGWLKAQYFQATSDGRFEVSPGIKKMVHFAPLNLVENAYPSLLNETHAMDVIFCRNVLMYFAPEPAQQVIEKMHRTQREGGWLIVGSSELPHLSCSLYSTIHAPDAMVYRKSSGGPIPAHRAPGAPAALPDSHAPKEPRAVPPAAIQSKAAKAPESSNAVEEAAALYAQGRYGQAADILDKWLSPAPSGHADAAALALLARCLANQGRLAEALRRCDQSIACDKCNAASRYLRALILQEQGAVEEAIESLRSALFLDPHFPLAHMALGALKHDHGQTHAAHKHLGHALEGLGYLLPDAIVPQAEGMTAHQLTNMIRSFLHEEAMP